MVPDDYLNASVIESNGSLVQLKFEKNINIYVADWTPSTAGQAVLYFNLIIEGFAPRNGHIIFLIEEPVSETFFLYAPAIAVEV